MHEQVAHAPHGAWIRYPPSCNQGPARMVSRLTGAGSNYAGNSPCSAYPSFSRGRVDRNPVAGEHPQGYQSRLTGRDRNALSARAFPAACAPHGGGIETTRRSRHEHRWSRPHGAWIENEDWPTVEWGHRASACHGAWIETAGGVDQPTGRSSPRGVDRNRNKAFCLTDTAPWKVAPRRRADRNMRKNDRDADGSRLHGAWIETLVWTPAGL